jgi:hypothetical protein
MRFANRVGCLPVPQRLGRLRLRLEGEYFSREAHLLA